MTTPSSVKFTLSFNASTQQQAAEQLTSLFDGVFDTIDGVFGSDASMQNTVNDLVLAIFHNARLNGYIEPSLPAPGDYAYNISLDSLDASGKRKSSTMTLSENITTLPSPPVIPVTSCIPKSIPAPKEKVSPPIQVSKYKKKALPRLKLSSYYTHLLEEGNFHEVWKISPVLCSDGFSYFTLFFEDSESFKVLEIRYINAEQVWISNFDNIIVLKGEDARSFIKKISNDERFKYQIPNKDMFGKWIDAPRYCVKTLKFR